MGSVGRVPSNLGDHGDQVYSVPSNFCNWNSFLLLEADSASADLLAEFKGRGKEEESGKEMGETWVSNNGRRGRDGGGKERGSVSVEREVPSNFSAVVAPTSRPRRSRAQHHCMAAAAAAAARREDQAAANIHQRCGAVRLTDTRVRPPARQSSAFPPRLLNRTTHRLYDATVARHDP